MAFIIYVCAVDNTLYMFVHVVMPKRSDGLIMSIVKAVAWGISDVIFQLYVDK